MTTGKRQRRNYPEDFKRDAVALVSKRRHSVAQAARSPGIGTNLVGRWKRESKAQGGAELLSQDEREELKRLRRENRELRMEKEIQKKRRRTSRRK